ncbi:MAG: hypothetical protein HKP14_04250 [Bacteroidia bacterium]|nr:hypothetical protein [Bacteroidia bacterium]
MYKSKNKPDRIILFEIGVIVALLCVNFILNLGYTSNFVIEEPEEQIFETAYVLTPYVEPQKEQVSLKKKAIQQKAMLFDPAAFIKQVDHLLPDPIIDIAPVFDHLPNFIPQKKVQHVKEPTNNIVTFASKKPQFPGGERALATFIQDNFNITQSMYDFGNIIKLDVEFVINKDGHVSDIKILRCSLPGLGAEQEALKMLNKMPFWVPAEHAGNAVNYRIIQPIKIQIY